MESTSIYAAMENCALGRPLYRTRVVVWRTVGVCREAWDAWRSQGGGRVGTFVP